MKLQKGGPIQATSKVSGSGWSVGADYKGRPAIFSKGAATAFMEMVKASGGKVRASDITSSKRSPSHNRAVGGVPNSAHLGGNAVDYSSGTAGWHWMKKNGSKYGWTFNNYMGPSGWHFDYVGGGASSATDTKEKPQQLAGKDGKGPTQTWQGNMFAGAANNSAGFGNTDGGMQAIAPKPQPQSIFDMIFGGLGGLNMEALGPIGGLFAGFAEGLGDLFKGIFDGGLGFDSLLSGGGGGTENIKGGEVASTMRFTAAQEEFASKVGDRAFGGQVIVVKRRRPKGGSGGGVLDTPSAPPKAISDSALDVTDINSGVDPVMMTDEMYRQFSGASF